ncbi:MAG: HAD family hydrolase [Xenococcaceae cyanobacterium MO_188.B32]|nr:HAD family hydrolase [Xenococcaceae cyanobacterium MO_188.B32]
MSRSIAEASPNCWKNVRLIATDMDGTLTREGKFTAELLQSLEKIAQTEIDVIIVTGRSAGWVEAVAHYLPVQGAIAENGGLFYDNQFLTSRLTTAIDNIDLHRQRLAQTFQLLQSKFPHLKESRDNRFRLTDWTFDVAELTTTELELIDNICQQEGWSFTYSTVQCHIKPLGQDKAIALKSVLSQYFPQLQSTQVVTVGDSPNDESLFEASQFPFSVGVANVLHYREQLQHQPTYVTSKAEVEGFRELVELICQQI